MTWYFAALLSLTQIQAGDDVAALEKRFGKENLSEGQAHVGEGETVPSTVLFAKTKKKTLHVVWKDEKAKKGVAEVRLNGDEGEWALEHGVTLGTPLATLRELNGKAFELSGFGWDYGGTVYSWKGGKLEALLPKPADVVLRVRPTPAKAKAVKGYDKVQAEKPFSSDLPVMKELDPRVYEIVVMFP